LNNGLTDRNIDAVAIDPYDTSILYAEAYGQLFKSTTSQENRAHADTGLPANTHPYLYALNPKQSVHVYAASGEGIFESANRGKQWVARNTDLAGTKINAVASVPTQPRTPYIGTLKNGVFQSTNTRKSRTPKSTGLLDMFIPALTVDPTNPALLYAATGASIFNSHDAGTHWPAANTGIPAGAFVGSLNVDPTEPKTLYAGTDQGVFRKTTAGASWTASNTGLPDTNVEVLALDPHNPQTLYVGTYSSVFKTADGGANWVRL
jgi:photosystem II stability/assembly factor-like uncharacterized protein